ncbi:MAG: ABC transporter ATP-binding protein, partial [Lachnospiraceae bacterium]|nr:ABC transporter ATP-binding protein [Lachnospiraceae bacterium]
KQKDEKARIKKLQNRLEKCEERISDIESMIADIDNNMALPENMSDSVVLNRLTNERADYESQLDAQMSEWEELSEALDGM